VTKAGILVMLDRNGLPQIVENWDPLFDHHFCQDRSLCPCQEQSKYAACIPARATAVIPENFLKGPNNQLSSHEGSDLYGFQEGTPKAMA
jgi:hypothetical protein